MKKTLLFILIGVIVILLVILGSILFNSYSELRGMREKVTGLEKQLNEKKSELLELKRKVYDLKHDPEAIETVAREKFRLVGQGEVVYTLEPKKKKKKNTKIQNKKGKK